MPYGVNVKLPARDLQIRLSTLLASAVAALVQVSCDSPASKTRAAPSASALPSPAAAPSGAAAATAPTGAWQIQPSAQVAFVMHGKIETIRGRIPAAKGQLSVDPGDIAATRGEIQVDLLSLVTETFDSEPRNTKQTRDARTWLEVSDAVEPQTAARHRWARFRIDKIDSADPPSVATLGGAERSAEVAASGVLILHGVESQHSVRLRVSFDYAGAEARGVKVKTVEPFKVDLKRHRVEPRDNLGKLLETVSEILQDKVAQEAEVSVDLEARLAP